MSEGVNKRFLVRLDRMRGVPESKISRAAIKRMVRSKSRPGRREECAVCGGWRAITHGHHLVSVGVVAEVLESIAVFGWAPEIPVVFLCPNHHAVWHAIEEGGDEVLRRFLADMSDAEMDRTVELAHRRDAARNAVFDRLREAIAEFEAEVAAHE